MPHAPGDFASGEGLSRVPVKAEGDKPAGEYVGKIVAQTPVALKLRLASGAEVNVPTTSLGGPPSPLSKRRARFS